MKLNLYYCEGCGKIISVFNLSKCPTKCCGEPMVMLKANNTGDETFPINYNVQGDSVYVLAGAADHPMQSDHYIQWVAIQTTTAAQIKTFQPGQRPEAIFKLADVEDVTDVYAYCNIHGLRKA